MRNGEPGCPRCFPTVTVSNDTLVTARCSRHPDRPAVSENDYRDNAMCAGCWQEYLRWWRALRE